jgi:hypothetical protein
MSTLTPWFTCMAGAVPSIRAIRATLHVGQPRAQQVRAHLVSTLKKLHYALELGFRFRFSLQVDSE